MPITPKQQELIRAKGLDPAVLEKTMGEEKIDKYFPDTSKDVAPQQRPVTAIAPSPAVRKTVVDPAAGIDRAVVVEPKQLSLPQIQVDSASSKPVIQVPTTKVPSVLGLEDLSRQMVVSRSTTPEGLIDPEKEKEAQEKADRIMAQSFTLGGTPRPPTTAFAAPAQAPKTGLEGLLAALKPQTIETPEQALQQSNLDRLTTMDAISQLDKEYREALDYFNKAGSREQVSATQKKLDDLNAPGDYRLKGDVVARKNYLLQYNALRQKAIEEGTAPPQFKPPTAGDVTDVAGELASDLLKSTMSQPGVGGKIVESAPAYALRMLGAPVSAAVGVGEAALTSKTIGETVPERIVGGAGVMGAGVDIGEAIADELGYTKEAADADNQAKGKRAAITAVAGGIGLVADFMLPIVPGSDIAGVAGKAGAEAFQVEKALGTATGEALKGAAKQAGKAAIGEARAIPVVGKYVPFEYGKDAYSQGIAKYASNAANQQTMSDIIKIGDELESSEQISKFDKLTYDAKVDALKKAHGKIGSKQSFDEFSKNSSAIGDILDSRLYKDTARDFQIMSRRATLDAALSAESKAKLAQSGALSSDSMMNDLLSYLNKAGDTKPFTNMPELFKRAGDIIYRKPKTGTAITAIDEMGMAALSKQHLQDIATRKLTAKYMSSPTQMVGLPDYTRLSKTSFVPVSETQKVIKAIENSSINNIKDRVVKALERGKVSVPVTKTEVAKINELIGSQALIGAENVEAINEINKLFIAKDGGFQLQISDYNNMVERVVDAYASNVPGYKSIFDVNKDLQSVTTTPKGGEKYVPTTSERITKEQYYNKILTPKEVAGGTFEAAIVGASKKAIEGSAPQGYSLLSTEFTDAVGQRFGAISDDFKKTYRANRSAGMSAPDAWSKTMVDNYNRQATDIVDKLKLEGRLDEAAEIVRGNTEQMFDDYMAMIFGGYESMIEAINTTGRSQFLDNMLIAPFEMRQLMFVASQNPMIKSLKQEFVAKALAGKNGDALVVLRNAHALTQGKPLKAFIASEKALEDLHTAAVASDKYGILKKGTGDVFKTDKAFQGERGIFEMWNYGGETAPMFFVDDHLSLLASQYMTRRQSAIISEVYSEWEKIYPELFPSTEGIKINSSRYAESLLSTPKEAYARQFIDSYRTGKFKIDFAPILKFLKEENPALLYLADDAIIADYLSKQADLYGEFANQTLRAALQDSDLTKKMYVALIEDSLTRLSASEQQATRYFNVVNASKKQVVDKLIEKFGGKRLNKDQRVLINLAYDNLFTSKEAYQYHTTVSNARDYVDSIYPMLRAETTPLFYDTLKTSIRNAANNNIAVLTRGALEQTQTIPLVFGETAAIKGALRRRGGIDEYTKTMEDLKISSDVRKLPPETEFSDELKKAIEDGLAATTDLRSISNKKTGPAKRLSNVSADLFGTLEAGFNDSRIASYAKGGVLGGQILPNFRYLTTNYITAPAIIYMQLGGKYASTAIKTQLMFDFKTNSVMKALLGSDMPGPMSQFAAPLDVRLGGGKVRPEIVVKAPNGKVYTNYDLANLIASGGVARSEASAELTKQVVEDIVSYASVKQKELLEKDVTGLSQIDSGQLKQLIVEAYGVPLAGGKRGMNIFSEWAAHTDTTFRVGIVRKALEDGMSEEQALQLGRESLFDYGNLSDFEKKTMNKAFWFWTFRRNSYRSVLKSALTNPARLRNTYLANGYIAEMDRENNIAVADYAALRPFIHLIDDKENIQRFGLYGPGVPALSATAELLDYMSVIPMIVNGSSDFKDSLASAYTMPLLAYAENATPAVQTAIGLSFGVDPRRDAKELGYYLDPRLMWYMQLNPSMWSTFQTLVNVEVVPANEEVPGRGTYQGRQWRIRKGDKNSVRNWFAIQQALLYAGLDRNLGDYAPLFETMAGAVEEKEVRDIRLGGEGSGTLMNIMYTAGVVTPMEAVTIQDRIEFNKRAIAEEFRKNTYDAPRR